MTFLLRTFLFQWHAANVPTSSRTTFSSSPCSANSLRTSSAQRSATGKGLIKGQGQPWHLKTLPSKPNSINVKQTYNIKYQPKKDRNVDSSDFWHIYESEAAQSWTLITGLWPTKVNTSWDSRYPRNARARSCMNVKGTLDGTLFLLVPPPEKFPEVKWLKWFQILLVFWNGKKLDLGKTWTNESTSKETKLWWNHPDGNHPAHIEIMGRWKLTTPIKKPTGGPSDPKMVLFKHLVQGKVIMSWEFSSHPESWSTPWVLGEEIPPYSCT